MVRYASRITLLSNPTKDAITNNPITEAKVKITMASPTSTGTTILTLAKYNKEAWREVASSYDQNVFQKEWQEAYNENSTHREEAEVITGNLFNAKEMAKQNGLKVSQVQFRTKDGKSKMQFVYFSRKNKAIVAPTKKLEAVTEDDFYKEKRYEYVFSKKGNKEVSVFIQLHRRGTAVVGFKGIMKNYPQTRFMKQAEEYLGQDQWVRNEAFVSNPENVNRFIQDIGEKLGVKFDATTDKKEIERDSKLFKESLPQEFEEDDVHYSIAKSKVSNPISFNKLNSIVSKVAKAVKAKLGIDVVACRDVEDLRQKLGKDKVPAGAEGCVYRGKVYVVASNIQDGGRVFEVLAHEIAAHIGARNVITNFDGVMKSLLKLENSDKALKSIFNEVRKGYSNLNDMEVAEEVFAKVMERVYNNELTLTGKLKNIVNYVIAKIKGFFRKLGINLNPSSREIYGIAAEVLYKTDFNSLMKGEVKGKTYDFNGTPSKPVFSNDRKKNSSEENKTSLKQQLEANKHLLKDAEPVNSIKYPKEVFENGKLSKEKVVNWAIDLALSQGNAIYKEGIGNIELQAKNIKNSVKSYAKSIVEKSAVAFLPDIIAKGIIVSGHEQHKGRPYSTKTIIAKVMLNGKTGNMAVVIKLDDKNTFKAHKILTPDGKEFTLDEKDVETSYATIENSPSIISTSNESINNSSENVNDEPKWSLVEDQQLLDELEKGETVKAYRAMQVIDGKLYPPMAPEF